MTGVTHFNVPGFVKTGYEKKSKMPTPAPPLPLASGRGVVSWQEESNSGSESSEWQASNSSATTIPRCTPGQRHFAEQFSARTRPSRALPCEFNELVGCGMTFHADETFEWIEHTSAHLNFIFPWEASCWFCDDFHFHSDDTGGCASDNFHIRMLHIRDHIANGDYVGHQRRRDYFLLRHLNENHLIPPQVARRELSTFEGPRVPNESDASRRDTPLRAEPWHSGEAYDQAAEDRRRRREHRDKGTHKKHPKK